jgi:protein-S-isoprenylcysteine O-methyltransferase Ste14
MMNSAGLLLLGLIVALYWHQVILMAARARRRTGRAANLLPPEPLGRALRVLWGPVVVVWIAHPIVSAFGKHPSFLLKPLWPSGQATGAAITWVSAIIALACFAATVFCWKRMGKSWRMGIDPTEKTPLVAAGPFAYVRHPIYALSALMMWASALALPSPLMLLAAVVHVSLLYWESTREERYLLRTHGSVYERYRTRVGRFVPISMVPYQAKE